MTGTGGCDDDNGEYSDYVEGYIVGSFFCNETDGETGQTTGNGAGRGYCILLEGSKNSESHWPMDFYTFNLPENLFDFPEEIISSGSHGDDCGPVFFPEDSRNIYKIRFKYQVLNKSEKNKFICGPCGAMFQAFPWDDYNEVSLKDVTNN